MRRFLGYELGAGDLDGFEDFFEHILAGGHSGRDKTLGFGFLCKLEKKSGFAHTPLPQNKRCPISVPRLALKPF